MTEQERQQLRKNPYAGLNKRPPEVNTNDWKNRHRISAKLTAVNYQAFYRFCTENGWSFSSGANALITTHPEINKELHENA
jgi:hypothetical protein